MVVIEGFDKERSVVVRHRDGWSERFKSLYDLKKKLNMAGVSLQNFASWVSPNGEFTFKPYEDWRLCEDGNYHCDPASLPGMHRYTVRYDDGEVVSGRDLSLFEFSLRRKPDPFKRKKRWPRGQAHGWRNRGLYHRQLKEMDPVGEDMEPPIRKRSYAGRDDPYENPFDRRTPKSWKDQTKNRAQWARF